MTQLTDRMDVLENQSKDGTGETKSHGDVNIEFHGQQILKDLKAGSAYQKPLKGPQENLYLRFI